MPASTGGTSFAIAKKLRGIQVDSEVSAMRWIDIIEFIGLVLLALLAVVLLFPLVVLSLQIVAVTGLLFGAALFCSWLYREAGYVQEWFVEHHRRSHRISPRRI